MNRDNEKNIETLTHRRVCSFYLMKGKQPPKKPRNNEGWFKLYEQCLKWKNNKEAKFSHIYNYVMLLAELLPINTQKKNKKARRYIKIPDDFYSSWDWKKLRYEAIKKYGRRCVCCGFVPHNGSLNYLVADHIKPVSKHPKLALQIENIQIMCNDCNMGKSNAHTDDWRE